MRERQQHSSVGGRIGVETPMPAGVMLGGVFAAEGLSLLVIGSAALWLRGVAIDVGDLDVVPDLSEGALRALCDVLGRYRLPRTSPPRVEAVLGVGIWSAQTAFGHIDVMVDTARREGAGLWDRSGLVPVLDAEVRVASSDDAWALRRKFKATVACRT